MSIETVLVTSHNLEESISSACEIFKECDHFAIRQEFTDSVYYQESEIVHDVMNIDKSSYFTVREDGEILGVSGYYTYHGYQQDAWLGWTGVLPKAQGKRIGEILVSTAMSLAVNDLDGLSSFRIWTSEEEKHLAALKLYRRLGFVEEHYLHEEDIHTPGARLVRIFSKSADPDKSAKSWLKKGYLLPDLEKFDMPRLDMITKKVMPQPLRYSHA